MVFGKDKDVCLGFNVKNRKKYMSFLEFPLLFIFHHYLYMLVIASNQFCLPHKNTNYFILKKRNKYISYPVLEAKNHLIKKSHL